VFTIAKLFPLSFVSINVEREWIKFEQVLLVLSNKTKLLPKQERSVGKHTKN